MVARLVATFFRLQEFLQPFIISPFFSPPLAAPIIASYFHFVFLF